MIKRSSTMHKSKKWSEVRPIYSLAEDGLNRNLVGVQIVQVLVQPLLEVLGGQSHLKKLELKSLNKKIAK